MLYNEGVLETIQRHALMVEHEKYFPVVVNSKAAMDVEIGIPFPHSAWIEDVQR